jgi:hypothetical protein
MMLTAGESTRRMAIVSFPERPKSAAIGASRIEILSSRLRLWIGTFLNRIGVPGAVRDASIQDELTGALIEVSTGPLFTKVTINGRDYYFDRLTGRYDGSGSGCS